MSRVCLTPGRCYATVVALLGSGPITTKTMVEYIFTAKNPRETWTAKPPIEKFYYDLGLLIDEDDTFYLAYGTKTIHLAKLSADGLQAGVLSLSLPSRRLIRRTHRFGGDGPESATMHNIIMTNATFKGEICPK